MSIIDKLSKGIMALRTLGVGEVMTMFFGVLFADVIGLMPHDGGGVVLPLLATQILWINLVTDGALALALGVDPADAGLMNEPPRPRAEGVITRCMWASILFVGAIIATGTLLVLDTSLPGGLIEGAGNMRYAQTMAFTTLMRFQPSISSMRVRTRKAPSPGFAAIRGYGWELDYRSCFMWR